jgi:hypothetical protein
MSSVPVLEHRERRPARWLRAKRFQVALVVGLAETLVILFTDATWRWAIAIAVAVFLFHIFVGRKSRFETVRQISWAAAGSQLLPLLVPIAAVFVATIAVVAVVVLAFVVVILLLLDRR